jgi:predicted site-specific integrase-resolvase
MWAELVTAARPIAPPTGDDLLTIQEGADRCTVDYETFRRWVVKGVLPHVIIGPFHIKRVRRRDVERLIQQGVV